MNVQAINSSIAVKNNFVSNIVPLTKKAPIAENTPNKIFFGNTPAINTTALPNTSLVTDKEKEKYNEIFQLLDKKNKKNLSELLATGKLLDKRFSNDNSTVLDNLYKIATTPRIRGLDKGVILNETVTTLYNPFVITQKFGDIPKKFKKEILQSENNYIHTQNLSNSAKSEEEKLPYITEKDLDVKSNCCVAASIEFNIAHRMPAEFARMVEQLTSENMTVTKIMDIKSVASNYVDSMCLLKDFKADPVYLNNNKIKLELRPDRNAIIRARIQNSYKDYGERSLVDVLMQSMLMNIGSSKTYNALTDTRSGQFNKGLANIEKTVAECLATGKNNILVNYQIIDDNMNLTGYECSFDELKKHITDSLDMGENVIIGYTYIEEGGKINPDGHEITIIGIEKGKNGKEYFVCKDTDNNSQQPIKYEVNEFLPRIHHAGIPKSVLDKNNVEYVEQWTEVLNQYQQMRTDHKAS